MSTKSRRLTIAATVGAMTLLSGCSKEPPATESGSGQKASEPANNPDSPVEFSYTVRGQIVSLPSADRPFEDLQIHHEAVPDFKDRDGNVTVSASGTRGMKAMTMPFPVAEGVSLDGIAVGDKVEFTFVYTWGGESSGYEITEIKKLPADTELNFGG